MNTTHQQEACTCVHNGRRENLYDDCPVHAVWFHQCGACERDLRTHSHAAGCPMAIKPSNRPDLVPTDPNYRFPETKAEEWARYDAGYCKHGTYVGGCGIDYMCHACEMGNSDAECVDATWLQRTRRHFNALLTLEVLNSMLTEPDTRKKTKWVLVHVMVRLAENPEVQHAHDALIRQGLNPYLPIGEQLHRG